LKRTSLTLAVAVLAVLWAAAPASAEIKTETFRFPVSVKGYQVKQSISGAEHPEVDGYITGMSTDIVDADGTPVSIKRLMLHHIVFTKVGEAPTGCENYTGFDVDQVLQAATRPFYGAGEERNVLALPHGYGLKMKANDPWLMVWMLMNHKKTVDKAFIQWKVTYDTDPNIKPVNPYWLDIKNCNADPIFSVPGGGGPGSTYSKSYDITMPESGHIVSAGGHVHGGAKDLVISQPDCGNRTIITQHPAWAMPDHPFYTVRPILHEPGPIAVSGTLTSQGYPVAQGERLRLTANYDNERTHTRVMGISMVYVAPSETPVNGCGPLPSDVETTVTSQPHRVQTPVFKVPIVGIGPNGKARTIQRPPGRTVKLRSGSKISVNNYFFGRANVQVKRGAKLSWIFHGGSVDNPFEVNDKIHNVTVANGPRGFASPNRSKGKFAYRFKTRGKYQIFCALHPVAMTETVTVK
jgi:plastocyanin